jgi:PrgI family protein
VAIYKVPQDVEAEDKLIGPFGFRQFIYLIIVAFACFVAFLLARISVVLIVIPLPFILFFTAIALPLRKDQPTEVYLAALLQYYLKPKKRMWMPDGVLSTVEITAPKTIEESRVKDISQDEALERINSLAQIMDTRGWAARGVFNPEINSTNAALSDQVLADAAEPDMLDDTGLSAKAFDSLINEQKSQQLQAVKNRMIAAQQSATPAETEEEKQIIATATAKQSIDINSHQKVITPLEQRGASETPTTPQNASDLRGNPDIIDLVDSPFSVATIASEMHRRDDSANEVEIKLH